MSTVQRKTRKGSDEQILRMNAIGMSLAAIANECHCHPTAITLRLKNLKVAAADTRRSFMEDILNKCPPEIKEELADFLTSTSANPISIKDHVRTLLIKDLSDRKAIVNTDHAPIEEVAHIDV